MRTRVKMPSHVVALSIWWPIWSQEYESAVMPPTPVAAVSSGQAEPRALYRAYVRFEGGQPPSVTPVATSVTTSPMPSAVWSPRWARNMPMPPVVAILTGSGMSLASLTRSAVRARTTKMMPSMKMAAMATFHGILPVPWKPTTSYVK